MDAFNYRDGELFAEGVALSAIAQRFGTPTYVYSRAHIEAQYRSFTDALDGAPAAREGDARRGEPAADVLDGAAIRADPG